MRHLPIIAAVIATASAETVTLEPSQDGDIYSFLDSPTNSVHTLNITASGPGAPHSIHSLVRFDLAGLGIPAAEIGSTKLKLYAYPADPERGDTGLGNVAIHRQGAAWSAATLHWNQLQPVGQPVILPVAAMNAFVEADVTGLVKQWAAGSAANHGFLLRPESEESGVNLTFLSMEMPDASYRPKLIVTRLTATPAPPVLSIRSSGGLILLEWPVAGGAGWSLQEAESPAVPWTTGTVTAIETGGNWTVAHPPAGRRFFRLAKP